MKDMNRIERMANLTKEEFKAEIAGMTNDELRAYQEDLRELAGSIDTEAAVEVLGGSNDPDVLKRNEENKRIKEILKAHNELSM